MIAQVLIEKNHELGRAQKANEGMPEDEAVVQDLRKSLDELAPILANLGPGKARGLEIASLRQVGSCVNESSRRRQWPEPR